ncbi:MAG: MGMT family protein [Acidobacteriota bacterium]
MTDEPVSVDAILDVIRAIPPGSVATYGQVAELAGYPGRARFVGRCLRELPDDHDVPWQRVISASGTIPGPPSRGGAQRQHRRLLEKEGVSFSKAGRIDLRRYRWNPFGGAPDDGDDLVPDDWEG